MVKLCKQLTVNYKLCGIWVLCVIVVLYSVVIN